LEEEIIANIAEEKKLAIENGHLFEGKPYIAVIGDGGWGVRSYNHSMKSSVGCVSTESLFTLTFFCET
jgi:hypothetical protein